MDVAEQRVMLVSIITALSAQAVEDGLPEKLGQTVCQGVALIGEAAIALTRIADALEKQNAMTAVMGRAQGYDV